MGVCKILVYTRICKISMTNIKGISCFGRRSVCSHLIRRDTHFAHTQTKQLIYVASLLLPPSSLPTLNPRAGSVCAAGCAQQLPAGSLELTARAYR